MDYRNRYIKYKPNIELKGGMVPIKKKKLVIHVSGPSGSGKTTLGDKLKKKFGRKIVVEDIDHLRMEFIRSHYGNRKFAIIDKVAYQKYIDNFVGKQKKPLVFVGLNNMFWWHDDHYYDMHSIYNFYIDIDDGVILEQKCTRLLRDIQNDPIAMRDLIYNNKFFMKRFLEGFTRDCSAKENTKVNAKWKKDYKEQKYIFMSRENIYKKICGILGKTLSE